MCAQNLHTWAKSQVLLVMLLMMLVSYHQAQAATTYWVSSADGDNSWDGLSEEQPFATLQKCNAVAQPGDTCLIREGTYREFIWLAHPGTADAPITFKAYENEKVTISGADLVTPGADGFGDWELYEGNIYRITLPEEGWVRPTVPPENIPDNKNFSTQVFLGDTMLAEARWPNFANPTLPKRDDYKISSDGEYLSFSTGAYTHPELAGYAEDFFKDARISFLPGHEWWGRFGTVTESSTIEDGGQDVGRIVFTYNDNGAVTVDNPEGNDPFMLWGKLAFLDTAGEFYIDEEAKVLYVWVDDGVEPNELSYSIKRREKGIDINAGKGHVRLEGLRFFACRIQLNPTSTDVVMDRIRSEYASHHMYQGWVSPAINMKGTNHVLTNSEILKTASAAIKLSGSGHTVTNNVVRETGYMPFLSDGIGVAEALDSTIERNTVFNTSTIAVSFAGLVNGKVINNRVFNISLQKTDTGALNSYAGGDGQGTEIAYNIIHDIVGYKAEGGHYGSKGIRLDSGETNGETVFKGNSNFLIHHNLIHNTSSASMVIWGVTQSAPNYGNSGNKIFNNTMDNTFFVNNKGTWSIAGTEIANNITGADLFVNLSDNSDGITSVDELPEIHDNLFSETTTVYNPLTGDPQYVNPETGDFTLAAGSPGIDAGIIPAYSATTIVGEAPDLGAFEQGVTPFTAGAHILPEHTADLTVSCEAGDENTADCTIAGFPPGRYPEAGLSLRFGQEGEATPATCTTETDSSNGDIVAHCYPSLIDDINSLPLFISFDGDEFLLGRAATHGDTTCDGVIDAKDGVFSLRVLVGNADNVQETCNASDWDISGNQQVGLEEAIHALRNQTEQDGDSE